MTYRRGGEIATSHRRSDGARDDKGARAPRDDEKTNVMKKKIGDEIAASHRRSDGARNDASVRLPRRPEKSGLLAITLGGRRGRDAANGRSR